MTKNKEKVKTQKKNFKYETRLNPKELSDKLKETKEYKKAQGEK